MDRRSLLNIALAAPFLCAAGLHAQYAPANAEWNRPREPFRVAANVYYVGASDVSSYLIATPEGHILLDTGFAESVPLVEAGIKKLGFRVEDIRILLASHAHYDHTGGMAAMKARTKARLLMNPAEVEQFARGGKGDFAFGDKTAFAPVKPDGLLRDGEEVRLGGIAVRVHFTPGHTKGCATYTMLAGNRRVVFPCSMTAPGYKLIGNREYPGIVRDYEGSFAKLRALECDIFLGGHSWDFAMPEKLKAGAGFVDPEGYRRWIDKAEAAFQKQLKEQRGAQPE